jgi:hypothetical protein
MEEHIALIFMSRCPRSVAVLEDKCGCTVFSQSTVFKGVEKTNDEYGEMVNPENHFFKQKNRILPQLKI